jgi:hypothetical protein
MVNTLALSLLGDDRSRGGPGLRLWNLAMLFGAVCVAPPPIYYGYYSLN